jgi:glc operon protein GlcG
MQKQVVVLLLSIGVVCSSGTEIPTLVIRDQIKLTLAGAERVLNAAKQQAAALGIGENIAIVDDGGHLLVFERMDGARPASVPTALTKARSAAMTRRETGPLFKGSSREDVTSNLAIEHAAAASGGTVTVLYGGIPILLDGQVVGAIGVGGGSEEQDVSVGRAGATALQQALSETHQNPKHK